MPSPAYPVFRLLTRLAARLILPATRPAALRRMRRIMRIGYATLPLPPGVSATPASGGSLPGEWLLPHDAPAGAALLFLHGGGWTLGLDSAHRQLAAQLARAAGLNTFCLDYRLAPEQPYPAALEDCLAAFASLQDRGIAAGRIGVIGDSAGANLTLALALTLKERNLPQPGALVGFSGVYDLEGTGDSFHATADAMLKPDYVLVMARHYAGSHDRRDPRLSPLWGDLAGLPPLLLQAGGAELLLSDSQRLAERATAAGVNIRMTVYPAMWHAWHVWAPNLPEASAAVAEAADFLRAALGIAPPAGGLGMRLT